MLIDQWSMTEDVYAEYTKAHYKSVQDISRDAMKVLRYSSPDESNSFVSPTGRGIQKLSSRLLGGRPDDQSVLTFRVIIKAEE